LALSEGSPMPLLCQWAVMEMKAKQPDRAAALVARARAGPDQRLAVKYHPVGESIPATLPPAQRKAPADDLAAALEQEPTPGEILGLVESAAQQRLRHLKTYRGQKVHEKTVLGFLERIPLKHFGEEQME